MEKYLLTIKEATEYFNIGKNKLYEMAKDPSNKFFIHNGNHILVKRKTFEEYLDNVHFI